MTEATQENAMQWLSQCLVQAMIIVFGCLTLSAHDRYADSLLNALENPESDSTRIVALTSLGYYYSGKDPEMSRHFARQALEDSMQLTDAQFYNNYTYLAYSYFDQHSYDTARTIFRKAYGKGLKLNDTLLQVSALKNISDCWRLKGNLTEAFNLAFEALRLAESIVDHRHMANFHNQIGEMYREQDDMENAVKHLQSAYDHFEKAGLKRGMLAARVNLALAQKLHEPELALHTYNSILVDFADMFNTWDSARIYSNLGNIYLDLKRYDACESSLVKALDCFTRIDQPVSQAYCHKELAILFVRTDQPKKAIPYAHMALDIADQFGHHPLQHQTSRLLGDAYAALGNYAEAHHYLSAFLLLNDSVMSQEKIALGQELEAKYATEKKEQQIRLQEETLARQEAEINQEFVLRNTLIGGVLLLIVIAALVYRNARLLRRKNRQIEESALRVRELQSTQSRWFTNIAHELRTPLTLILGPIQHLLKHPEIPSSLKPEVRLAKKYGDDLVVRVNEILEISRLESGKLELKAELTDLSAVVRQVAAAFESYASEKGIMLRTEIQTEPLVMLIDQQKVTTILNNLVSNAIKFTPVGKEVHLELDCKESVMIRVADAGIGISEEDLPHVFDRFYQSAGHKKEAFGGSGVGLTLSQELAKLHGGQIVASSVEGKGSTFTLLLPAARVKGGEVLNATEVLTKEEETIDYRVPQTFGGSQPRILLVEDHPDMRSYIRRLLEPEFDVREASDGVKALDALENFLPDLIISDVKMPDMDGLTFARKVKEDERLRLIPFISLTAHANEKDRLTALKTGVDDYLLKPFHAEELLARVHNLIVNARERRKALEELTESNDKRDLSHEERLVNEWEQFVRDHLAESSFSVHELAKHASLSESSLNRQLKKVTGLTPGNFIREIRMQTALQLLESRQYPTVSEVVYMVGFEDVSSFSRLFKKRFGKSPSAYLRSVEV